MIAYGDNAIINEHPKTCVMEDITLPKVIGMNPFIVHGGGPQIASTLKGFDIKSEFVNRPRVTDATTMEVAPMVLVGKINKAWAGPTSSTNGSPTAFSWKSSPSREIGTMILQDRVLYHDHEKVWPLHPCPLSLKMKTAGLFSVLPLIRPIVVQQVKSLWSHPSPRG